MQSSTDWDCRCSHHDAYWWRICSASSSWCRHSELHPKQRATAMHDMNPAQLQTANTPSWRRQQLCLTCKPALLRFAMNIDGSHTDTKKLQMTPNELSCFFCDIFPSVCISAAQSKVPWCYRGLAAQFDYPCRNVWIGSIRCVEIAGAIMSVGRLMPAVTIFYAILLAFGIPRSVKPSEYERRVRCLKSSVY